MRLAIALTLKAFDQARCQAERDELSREAWAILRHFATD